MKTQLSIRFTSFSGNGKVQHGACIDITDVPSGNLFLRAYLTHEEAGKLITGYEGVTFQADVHLSDNIGKKHEYREVTVVLDADEPSSYSHGGKDYEAWAKHVQALAQKCLDASPKGRAEGWRARLPHPTNTKRSKGKTFTVFADRYVEVPDVASS